MVGVSRVRFTMLIFAPRGKVLVLNTAAEIWPPCKVLVLNTATLISRRAVHKGSCL